MLKKLFATLFLFAPCALFAADTKIETPNIVLIFIDDLGYGDVAPFGGSIPTPNLDKLAKEGRRFTDFASSCPYCSPSRAAILTGALHARVGIHNVLMADSPIGLNPNEETIAEVVKKKGYATAIFGKWHVGDRKEWLPLNQGFDEYYGIPYSNDIGPDRSIPLYRGGLFIDGNKQVDILDNAEKNDSLTARYTERAVKFIEKNKDQPFFLYLAHNAVHTPLGVGEKFKGKTQYGKFGDDVFETDWSVGEIVKTLDRLDLRRKTLVIFTSDNGPALAGRKDGGYDTTLREGKGTVFEGGVREPTIFSQPGTIPEGTSTDQFAATIDILPTVAAMIGAPLSGNKIDGKDIRPLLYGKENAVSPHETYPIYLSGKLLAVRDTRWKLIFPHEYYTSVPTGKADAEGYPEHKRIKQELALYDLQNDVSEMNDVKAEHPEIVERLQKAAHEWLEELGDKDNAGKGTRPAGKVED
ncbi:MAG: sulfatase [Planctomycetaceae bacterium]|jgi:arylsulfatase A-like enzyme|nr:sulfatase [Planctomycetaceae bacterium]